MNHFKDTVSETIVPMAGVAMLVLIMLMVTAPVLLTHSSTKVNLPETGTAETKLEENLSITITPEGLLTLNDRPISPDSLKARLKQYYEKDPYRLTIIRADKKEHFGKVIDLLSVVKSLGAKRIAFATVKKKEKRL
ncbi:MAG: biopolymer transporter ExbD [Candidatus Hydrothermae bacterium]|nr:biopolymer transporter ExbD [Candidatus Hydrothermae bacterium]